MGGWGKGWGKDREGTSPVQKPWLKQVYSTPPWQSGGKSPHKGYTKGYTGWSDYPSYGGYSSGDWGGKSGYSFKGKGKDGKGGKKGGAPPANSPYWEQKMSGENREILDGLFDGTVHSYNVTHGWGFIVPSNVESLPPPVVQKLEEMRDQALASGKQSVGEDFKLYFRKPDIQQGFMVQREASVAFSIYIDDKGAGACEVHGA
eukprot:CAMPEP_0171173664 /NCGR_PEP_ID=MMETSP0790-20130122/10337_1 /TAXON_ID=2925 /ORGANISM="Alexandrium catenella, Strain OF101" /LENGTH=202 /DNA_ID=CAMNT_0011638531 /DNA_START=26 /DNA_END=634 /DNA_ORIENTATION=+